MYKLSFLALSVILANLLQAQCWSDIFNGGNSTFVIDNNLNLYACGSNTAWQLGVGSDIFSTDTLIKVSPGNRWIEISTGIYHTLALKEDGSLWAWGSNRYGQLGIGNAVNEPVPVQVGSDMDWAAVNTGLYSSVALKQDGTLWAWGRNILYQLGLGDAIDRSTPSQVGLDDDWVSYSTGNVHTLALKEDGTLWAWGNNFNGQLGNGTRAEARIPTQISSDTAWVEVSCEGLHSLALKQDGTLWAWGNNDKGQLGIDSMISSLTVPRPVTGENRWVHMSTSESNSAGINTEGELWLWGSGQYGQLGTGDTLNQLAPIIMDANKDWKALSLGLFHISGITEESTVFSWGRNNIGQLGTGNLRNSSVPIQRSCDGIISDIHDIQEIRLMVYPNPVINELNIYSEYEREVYLLNAAGQLVHSFTLTAGMNEYSLNFLARGSYLLKTTDGLVTWIIK